MIRIAAKKKHVDPLPDSFSSLEEAAEFWDTHDTTDYLDQTKPVNDIVFDIKRRRYLVSLEPSLWKRMNAVARQEGVASETLVNLWVQERLDSLAAHGTRRRHKPKTA